MLSLLLDCCPDMPVDRLVESCSTVDMADRTDAVTRACRAPRPVAVAAWVDAGVRCACVLAIGGTLSWSLDRSLSYKGLGFPVAWIKVERSGVRK